MSVFIIYTLWGEEFLGLPLDKIFGSYLGECALFRLRNAIENLTNLALISPAFVYPYIAITDYFSTKSNVQV